VDVCLLLFIYVCGVQAAAKHCIRQCMAEQRTDGRTDGRIREWVCPQGRKS